MRVYLGLLSASLRSQLSYRASFLLSALGSFLVTGVEVIGLWALFDRFGQLKGWQLYEVAMIYGQVNVAMAVADGMAAGFARVPAQIRSGDFDRVLLRPRPSALLVMCQEVALRRVGRLLQGALVLGWALLRVSPSASGLMVLAWSMLGATALFFGLFVLSAAAAFWTVESLEVFSAFSYGGSYAAQYPMTIYASWFRQFFTYVVPLSLVSYFPALVVLGREDPLGTSAAFQAAAPAGGLAFLALSLVAWRLGLRRYASTGS